MMSEIEEKEFKAGLTCLLILAGYALRSDLAYARKIKDKNRLEEALVLSRWFDRMIMLRDKLYGWNTIKEKTV